MATRMFSEDQLEQLRSFPDISKDDLIRYFTLTPADIAFVDLGRGRGPADRLGFAVQLSTLPWLGFVPDEVTAAPPVAVARLAQRLGLDWGETCGTIVPATDTASHMTPGGTPTRAMTSRPDPPRPLALRGAVTRVARCASRAAGNPPSHDTGVGTPGGGGVDPPGA